MPGTTEIEKPLNLTALAEKARRAVVLIVGYDAEGNAIKTGSGFFVSAGGRLVTNRHVIEGVTNAQAKLESGAIYNIEGVLASSSVLDLAVLQADARDVQFLPVDSTSSAPPPGTRIAVIGSPLALENTLSEGIVSANRTVKEGSWLQISAPISPGSSGSPVLDQSGRVIGVATFVFREGQSLNFARSSRDLANFLEKIPPDAKPTAFAAAKPPPTIFDDAQFRSARSANDRGDGAQALELLNRVGEQFPNDRNVIAFERGRAYFYLGLYEDSFLAFRQYAKWHPTDPSAWHNLMRSAFYANHLDEALSAGWQEVKMKPDADTLAIMSTIYYNRGELPLALATIKQANKIRSANRATNGPRSGASPSNSPSTPRHGSPTTQDRPVTYRVAGIPKNDYLSVREGPGTTYPIVLKLPPNQRGITVDETEAIKFNEATAWQKIFVNGYTGWVNSKYLSLDLTNGE